MQILPTISMPIVGGPIAVFVGPRALMIPASTCGPDPQRRLVSAIGMGASEIPP